MLLLHSIHFLLFFLVLQNGQPVEDSTQHYGSTSVCTSSPVQPFIYSQESCVGGHMAGILSLLVTERASLDMEIPDEMLDVDRLAAEDHAEAEDQRGTGMVTLLKRKIYSQNVEDALSLNDDSNLSSEGVKDDDDDEDGDDGDGGAIDADDSDEDMEITEGDRDDNGNDDDNDDDVDDDDAIDDDYDDKCDGSRVPDFIVDSKPTPSSFEAGGTSMCNRANPLTKIARSSNIKTQDLESDNLCTPKRSSLRKKILKSIHGSKSFVPKKRRKVTFSEPDLKFQTSLSSSNEALDDGRSPHLAVGPKETYRSSGEDVSMNGESCIQSDTPYKKFKLDGKTGSTYSVNLTHKVRTNCGSVCFLSRQSYINKFLEATNRGEEHSKLTPEFAYIDNEENVGTRGSLAIVPRRGLDVRKTRLHASRVTLLLHRSIDQDSDHLKKHLFKSMECMVLNPIDIAIYLKPQAQSDMTVKSHSDLNTDKDVVGSGCALNQLNEGSCSNVDFSKEECEKLDRFMRTEPITYEKSELNEALSLDDIKEFCNTMVENFNWNEHEVKFTNEVLGLIIEAKHHGLTEEEIGIVYLKYRNLRPLEEILQMCVNFRLLLRVGILSKRYVACGLASNWCFITSLKSLKQISEEVGQGSTQTEGKLSNQEGEIKELEYDQGEDGAGNSNSKYYQTVCKPWLKLNGDYNVPLLQKFQNSVLVLIMMCPGITESAIYGHFRPVLARVALTEILEFLEMSNCITKHISNRRKKPRLFDSVHKAIEIDVTHEDPYYVPKIDCILNNVC